MTIDEKVREIADNVFPDWTFVFDDWYGADKTVSKVALPAIIELLPYSGNIAERNGMMRNSQNCSVAFLDRVTKDGDGGDQSEVYNRMEQAAEEFLRALNASGYFEPITDVLYYVIYEQMSTIVTGVYLDLTLVESKGRC